MIEVAYVEGPGIILSLGRSESGGWERNGKQLPWCGVLGHQHDGLSGFKVAREGTEQPAQETWDAVLSIAGRRMVLR